MKSISIEISNPKDEKLIFTILEVFRQKKMLKYRELNDEAAIPISKESLKKLKELIAEADREAALNKEDDYTRPGPPMTEEQLLKIIDETLKEEALSEEESEAALSLLKKGLL